MFLAGLSLKAKIGIGLVSSYLLYTAVVIYRTNREIERRAEEYKRTQDPVARFGPLKIWGQYQNPFIEYEHETLFHFAYNQFLKLFNWDSIQTQNTKHEWRQQMPLYQPDLTLMLNNKHIKNDLENVKANLQDNHLTVKLLEGYQHLPPLSRRLLYTFLGQSCAVVQISNLNVLTDPVFAAHIIHQRLGPKRITPSPAQLGELPIPDIVLVSHNHPDHLEPDVVEQLSVDKKNKTVWAVPDGMGPELISKGVNPSNVLEMPWWSTKDISSITNDPPGSWEVACVPAMHWSGRYLYDSNRSLWCLFVILHNQKPVFYHMGDTGYHTELFEAIRRHAMHDKPVSLMMAPIGQYAPATNKTRHMSPKEAVDAHIAFKAAKTVGVHYGTFVLSSEPVLEPRRWFTQEATDAGVAEKVVPGEFGRTEIWEI